MVEKRPLYHWILAILYFAFALSVIFYPQLGAEAPFAEFLGQEYASEIVLMIGTIFMARREAEGDFALESNNLYVDHAWSFFQRVVGFVFAMVLLNYPANMDFLHFVWNLSMWGAIYSFFFNQHLNWKRGKYFFEYIKWNNASVYDRAFRFFSFGNGHVAGVVKAIFEGSAIPALFILRHFV